MKTAARTTLALTGAAAVAVTAFAIPASAAPARPAPKGTTTVVTPLATAVLAPGSKTAADTYVFRITGKPTTLYKHVGGIVVDGSKGVRKDKTLQLRNFWVDTKKATVSAAVEGLGRETLFTLADVTPGPNGTITATLKATLAASQAIAGDASLVGATAGTATVAPVKR